MDGSLIAQVALASQLGLGVVFVLSFLPKLRRPSAFAQSAIDYDILPAGGARWFGMALIPVEALLAISFLTGWLVNIALPLAAILIIAFLVAVCINLSRNRRISCGCFGTTSEEISFRTVARLLLLLMAVAIQIVFRIRSDEPLPTLASVGTDALAFKHLMYVASFSTFLILSASWILAMPEVVSLARNLHRDQSRVISSNSGIAEETT